MSLWVFSCNFLKILAKGVPEAMEKFFQDSSLWVSCNFLEDIGQRYAGGYGEISLCGFCTVFLKILAKGTPEAMEKIFQDSSLWVSCNFFEDIGHGYAGGHGEIFPGHLFVDFVQFS